VLTDVSTLPPALRAERRKLCLRGTDVTVDDIVAAVAELDDTRFRRLVWRRIAAIVEDFDALRDDALEPGLDEGKARQ
jgi:hypothetical protein